MFSACRFSVCFGVAQYRRGILLPCLGVFIFKRARVCLWAGGCTCKCLSLSNKCSISSLEQVFRTDFRRSFWSLSESFQPNPDRIFQPNPKLFEPNPDRISELFEWLVSSACVAGSMCSSKWAVGVTWSEVVSLPRVV
jgi:hypothetical protein